MGVEKSQRHADFIRNNAAAAGYGNILETRTQDVFPAMKQLAESGRQFDLIFADPPYGEKNVNRRSTSFAQQLLDDKSLPKLLAPGGRFILGHTKRDTLELVAPWTEVKTLKHGDTLMRFLEQASDATRATDAS
jgi:16S rRNA G966 N2-methylase RsmD